MKIVNLIHIGDEIFNFDEMSQEDKNRIAEHLNKQALEPLGYKKTSHTDKTA